MIINTYSFTANDIQKALNDCKGNVIERLCKDGYIDVSKMEQLQKEYLILAYERGWFGKLFDSFFDSSRSDKELITKIVRLM